MNSMNEKRMLSETKGLVEMVEFLLAGAETSGRTLPWTGIRATLREVRDRLGALENSTDSRAEHEPLATSSHPEPEPELPELRQTNGVDHSANEVPASPSPGTLASRIQMAPLPRAGRRGYSRELGTPETPKQQEPASVD